jgi:hypothetical protein
MAADNQPKEKSTDEIIYEEKQKAKQADADMMALISKGGNSDDESTEQG